MSFLEHSLGILFAFLLLQNLLKEIKTTNDYDDQPAFNDTNFAPRIDSQDEMKLILQQNMAELSAQIRNITLENQALKDSNLRLQNDLMKALDCLKDSIENTKTAQTTINPEFSALESKLENKTDSIVQPATFLILQNCTDNAFFANCELIVRADYCGHKYYMRFCCKSCTLAGKTPVAIDQLKAVENCY